MDSKYSGGGKNVVVLFLAELILVSWWDLFCWMIVEQNWVFFRVKGCQSDRGAFLSIHLSSSPLTGGALDGALFFSLFFFSFSSNLVFASYPPVSVSKSFFMSYVCYSNS